MFVCSCRAVSDRTVRAAVASGARTVEEVGVRCGAGTSCGGCHDLLRSIIAEVAAADPVGRAGSAA